MLRHGGSQTCAVEGAFCRALRQERHGVLEYMLFDVCIKSNDAEI